MLSTSNTTCLLKTSATVCGTLMAAPVAGCLYGQAIRLTAVPLQRSVYHSRLDARNRSYPPTPEPNDTLVGLKRSLAGPDGKKLFVDGSLPRGELVVYDIKSHQF